ncbi:MAG: hypothetical protein HZA13_02455 [Nitrospirae bacterium]|nr:hypothetical protein [Nitrospirota bacterium]
MIKLIRIGIIFALGVALSPSLGFAGSLKTQGVFGPYWLCDSIQRQADWTNSVGTTIFIKKMVIWLDLDIGGKSEINATIYRSSDSSVVGFADWNHYAEPTTLHQVFFDYSPDFFVLASGDNLRLFYSCTNDANNPHGQVSVLIMYTTGAP